MSCAGSGIGNLGALGCDLIEGQAGRGVDGIIPGKGPPTLDGDIDESWLLLQGVGPPVANSYRGEKLDIFAQTLVTQAKLGVRTRIQRCTSGMR